MLCWITTLGGVLIMMGQQARSEALFYYFRLEDQVPENHLLRLIEKHISFAFVRERLKDSYSETGRPSIDPELLLRILLLGYLYGITSERKLVEELRMHLAWRWFTGLGFRSGDPASLHVLQESALAVPGIEAVRAAVWRDCGTLSGSRTGAGATCRWMVVSSRPMLPRRAVSRGSS